MWHARQWRQARHAQSCCFFIQQLNEEAQVIAFFQCLPCLHASDRTKHSSGNANRQRHVRFLPVSGHKMKTMKPHRGRSSLVMIADFSNPDCTFTFISMYGVHVPWPSARKYAGNMKACNVGALHLLCTSLRIDMSVFVLTQAAASSRLRVSWACI